jgi:hypothetical protein
MQVKVIYALASVGTTVSDQTVAALSDTLLYGELIGDGDHLPQQPVVFAADIANGFQVLIGNDQNVGWRLWVGVVKSDYHFVFVDDVCGSLARYDTAENTVHGGLLFCCGH